MANIISLVIAYLLGSLNSAVLISKYLKLPDPRTTGSGNAGASNILRTVGKNQALMVLLGDGLKGVLAVLLARALGAQGFILGLVALAAVAGHIFPVFFKFKGGKGVATMMGAALMLTFWVGLFSIVVWLVIAFLLRYASLASIVAAICAPLFMLIFGNHQYAFPLLLVTALVIWRHWENVERLRSGTETKIQLNSGSKETTEKTAEPAAEKKAETTPRKETEEKKEAPSEPPPPPSPPSEGP